MNHSRLGVTAGVTLFLTGFAAGCGDQPPPLTAQETPASCELEPTSIELPGEVYETSGLAASHRQRDLFWTHNDRGHEPELFAITAAGALAQRVRVTGADLVDWEDIESGPCGDVACLYIGDIGDAAVARSDAGLGSRREFAVIRIARPDPGAVTSEEPVEADDVRMWRFDYADGLYHNAETLLVEPGTNRIYVVEKTADPEVEAMMWVAPEVLADDGVDQQIVDLLNPGPTGALDRGGVLVAAFLVVGDLIGELLQGGQLFLEPLVRLRGDPKRLGRCHFRPFNRGVRRDGCRQIGVSAYRRP